MYILINMEVNTKTAWISVYIIQWEDFQDFQSCTLWSTLWQAVWADNLVHGWTEYMLISLKLFSRFNLTIYFPITISKPCTCNLLVRMIFGYIAPTSRWYIIGFSSRTRLSLRFSSLDFISLRTSSKFSTFSRGIPSSVSTANFSVLSALSNSSCIPGFLWKADSKPYKKNTRMRCLRRIYSLCYYCQAHTHNYHSFNISVTNPHHWYE